MAHVFTLLWQFYYFIGCFVFISVFVAYTVVNACLVSITLYIFVLIEYVVEFEDQESKDRGWEELKRVGGNKESVQVTLWPYMSYRFRLIAINDVGKSNPSKPSEIHNTPAEG